MPYTITVANHGPSDIAAATVADNFDAGRVSTVSWSCSTARALTDLGQLVDGAGGVNGLDGASAVAATRDGKHVYATASADNSVSLFQRDATTGLLTFGTAYTDGTDGQRDPGRLGDRRLSERRAGLRRRLRRERHRGLHPHARERRCWPRWTSSVDGPIRISPRMTGPRGIAVAPDGRHVYVAAATGSAVVVFTRNLTTGALTWQLDRDQLQPGRQRHGRRARGRRRPRRPPRRGGGRNRRTASRSSRATSRPAP